RSLGSRIFSTLWSGFDLPALWFCLVSVFLKLGYLVGFGPLLIHFIGNPNLYLGRGASLLIWSPHLPISFTDFHAPGKRFGQCCPRTCLGSALTLHKTSYSMDPCCYLPNALYWFWALLCFCGTGVIRPRFSYLPPGWASCLSAARSWRIRTVCH